MDGVEPDFGTAKTIVFQLRATTIRVTGKG